MRAFPHGLCLAQVLLAVVAAVTMTCGPAWWWLPGLPWLLLVLPGLALTAIPVLLLGVGAGAAQADWMSDGVVLIVVYAIPTTLSVGLTLAWARGRAPPESSTSG